MHMGQASTVESIIYGREPDSSRANNHGEQDSLRKHRDYAGQTSAQRQGQMDKTMRRVLNCSDRAGSKNMEATFRPMKGPGVSNPESMHELIYGRSGVENARGTRAKSMSAAGKKTDPELQRQEGVSVSSARWASSSVQLGDSDNASPPVREERFQGYAGRKPERMPQRSSCLRSVSAVDKLLYGRDLSHAKDDAIVEYAKTYAGHAGFMWKLKPKSELMEASADSTDASTLEEIAAKRVFEPPSRKLSDTVQPENVEEESSNTEASKWAGSKDNGSPFGQESLQNQVEGQEHHPFARRLVEDLGGAETRVFLSSTPSGPRDVKRSSQLILIGSLHVAGAFRFCMCETTCKLRNL
eukprot:CAMPEP_0114662794 /NCGR_PEP_ID=MMETSP0191-20121206/25587_1 /TAXON_ID=126664 /ORGANISM="Sorites sp." /LENGTH=354 /DNA_ID=CAMNT_0001900139 /DNA_START=213 /DNA_END=1278 /DNA_ORIENTATION=+